MGSILFYRRKYYKSNQNFNDKEWDSFSLEMIFFHSKYRNVFHTYVIKTNT